ncbi:hypothetical protein B0H63DRAFT_534943 [Podospora didyma]|uniref:Uncharacterized protein n=1 Tax=Podospora didyma TaxID=330526 RepID=A0AAE0N2L8_9PEZI|nr:hypothetical protein B0H63DRAFT_534943 [Podospora didyma]
MLQRLAGSRDLESRLRSGRRPNMNNPAQHSHRAVHKTRTNAEKAKAGRIPRVRKYPPKWQRQKVVPRTPKWGRVSKLLLDRAWLRQGRGSFNSNGGRPLSWGMSCSSAAGLVAPVRVRSSFPCHGSLKDLTCSKAAGNGNAVARNSRIIYGELEDSFATRLNCGFGGSRKGMAWRHPTARVACCWRAPNLCVTVLPSASSAGTDEPQPDPESVSALPCWIPIAAQEA